jgi:hypothetical protein
VLHQRLEAADRAPSTPLGRLRNPCFGIRPDFPNSFSTHSGEEGHEGKGQATISSVLSKVWCTHCGRSPLNPPFERSALIFSSLTSRVVTAVCALVGAIALLGTFYLTVTGGSPYLQFALALLFFAMFIVGSYWWMVFGPGRGL